ncbi:MAG: DUF3592 domain-containing protein [Archangium sp.]|nr:DUF3592 domain-containing protein [Archangium sp.]
MQLAIPSAPRPVKLSQIPGALRRVAWVALAAVLATALGWFLAARAQSSLSAEREFLERAHEVQGQVTEVVLPPIERRLETPAKLRVIYKLGGRDYAASGLQASSVEAEQLFIGSKVALLVDPAAPTKAQDALWLRGRVGWVWLGTLIVGLGLLLGAGLVAFEVRRAIRREVAPLRWGALVWLTADEPLPDSKEELRFAAHYFRDDVKQVVMARGRPGRRPVRNGEKVLAAVVPSEPTWVRVIDEELARVLGWYR